MSGSGGGRWLAVCVVGIVGCGNVEQQRPINDAPIDASPDAVAAIQFDVAYVNEIRLTPSFSSVFSFIAVVNSGSAVLDTSSASVVSYIDDNPGINWTFKSEMAATKPLAPGLAAGTLSPGAKMRIDEARLLPESIDDPFLNFSMSFPQPPPVGITLNAQAVLRIAGKDVALPFVIHVVETGDLVLANARRTTSQP